MSPEQQMHEAAKALPAITVSSMTFAGFAVQEWLILVTIVYTVLQIVLLARRLVTARKGSDKDPACAKDCPAVLRRKP